MTKEEAQVLLADDFGKALLKAASDYAIPLFWGTPDNDHWQVCNNGTAFILDCGQGPFLVTAAHVYEGYLAKKEEVDEIVIQLGNIQFNLDEKELGNFGSEVLDIATFEITTDEIESLNKSILVGNQENWPPSVPADGNGVLFSGYPGQERLELDDAEVNFGIYAALTPIESVSDRNIGCAFDRSEWIDTAGLGLPPEGFDLGGVSGAPLLVVDESPAGIFSWRLGGVIYNASPSCLGEIMLAHHAHYICPNGGLNKPA